LLGLKWDDVNLEDRVIRVRRTLTRTENGKGLALGEPKTKKSRRTVRLTPASSDALKRHRARQAEEKLKVGALYEDQGLVFATHRGTPINPSNLRRRSLAPLLNKAGCLRSPSTTCATRAPHSCSKGTYIPSSFRSFSATPPSP